MRVGLVGTGRIGVLHAGSLLQTAGVEELVLADADGDRAVRVAAEVGAAAAGVDELFSGRVDALVIAATSSAHADLLYRGADAGLTMFCEKPLAADLAGTLAVIEHLRATGASVQVGFQRRFDAGYRAAREVVRSGRLGFVHTLRAVTCDMEPPDPSYLPGSGGLFRDCSLHDFDVIRYVCGREVVAVYAAGANLGEAFFAAAGDVDTAAALLTLDDGALATVTAARYNGAGYDIRLEVAGSEDTLVVGLDDRAPLRSAEPGVRWPAGRAYTGFYDRFQTAYAAELAAFVEHARGRAPNPCPPGEALEALYVAEAAQRSRDERRVVSIDEVRASEPVR
jgi:myo-inositol 2-dehydrogenase/D-chiro-inositol 1-dehydrogenase